MCGFQGFYLYGFGTGHERDGSAGSVCSRRKGPVPCSSLPLHSLPRAPCFSHACSFAELSLPLSLLSPFSALKSFSPQTRLTHLLSAAPSIVLRSQEHPLSHSRVCTSPASPAMVPVANLLGQGPLQPAGALPCAEIPIWRANGRAPGACPARPPLSGSGFSWNCPKRGGRQRHVFAVYSPKGKPTRGEGQTPRSEGVNK